MQKKEILREYQRRAIDQLYAWMQANDGNPCLVLPTGAGKSHIVAALCKEILQEWPETRLLMLTHVKELIEQNAEKMRQHWPGAPMGIYSSSLKKRDLTEPITFAGIQSIAKKVNDVGYVDIVIIDECHLVNHKENGNYRQFLAALKNINPHIRVIGLTATPYRLGHGYITDAPAIFDALIEPIGIEELVFKGFLSTLKSKITKEKLIVDGVHKRGGEFIEKELQAAVNVDKKNCAVIDEVLAVCGDRKAWLFFCAGVSHAQNIAEILNMKGVSCVCITGDMPRAEREKALEDFKSGRIKAVTNANVLTTGFDHPDIDMIVMLRPTMSPGLYVQMAGRGLRVKPHTDHCLVLDFAGVVQMHGPITAVAPPEKNAREGAGDAPVKICDECGEICAISARDCVNCGAQFPAPPEKTLTLRGDDIMGIDLSEMEVKSWQWLPHTARASGKEMIIVRYKGQGLIDYVTEPIAMNHEGIAGRIALKTLGRIVTDSGVDTDPIEFDITSICEHMNKATPPKMIKYRRSGKYFNVKERNF